MRMLSGLRTQLAVGAALLALLVVAIAGGTLAWQLDRQDRLDVDTALQERSERISADIGKMLGGAEAGHVDESPDPYGDLLGGSESLVRLMADGELVAQRGELPSSGADIPAEPGLTTVEIDGVPWRSLVLDEGGAQLQVLQSLAPVESRLARNLLLVAVVTAGATLLGALGGSLIAARLLRPLESLRIAAVTLRDDRDGDELLPVLRTPTEVADLTSTLNTLLHRLRASTDAARRFTADAGHELRNPLTSIGAYLEALERLPDPDPPRSDLVGALREEYGRVVSLLNGLQALARGDAGVLPPREQIEVSDVVDDAIAHARLRHSDVQFVIHSRSNSVVGGWRDGIRGAIDNLLENAAIHGRPAGTVVATLEDQADSVVLTVSDDGPGIPAGLRADMLRRFVRGERTRSAGSGLGLALVAQQAELHGGEVRLGESETGGLEAVLRLPLSRGDADQRSLVEKASGCARGSRG